MGSTSPGPRRDDTASRGRVGEDATVRVYQQRGYRVLERNWRCALGEIDVIAEYQDVLAFCEVKTRTGVAFGGGYEAVTWSKRRRLRRLADAFLASRPSSHARIRFDVASVWLGRRGADVELFEDAF
jgi:putative endonuclease